MKECARVIGVVMMICIFGGIASAQVAGSAQAAAEKPGGVVVEAVSGTATVQAVDAEKRTVTLKSADGTTKTYKLGPEARNFDQIKVGDIVRATLAESVAIYVRKSDEQPSAEEIRTVEVAPKGAKPGVIITDTVEITAKVEAIDYGKRTVTLRGPQGNVMTLPVDASVAKFDNVKIGDELVIRVTDALAIDVEKP
jgi:hypothetical protein